ncbi:hypothetical protein [Candidatus Poriferisodalis sp.]|uniref:hypothetical protein n=1 Tax=Candidatus Poriferisodalis sp. TaxID=3101277 RepID=UPI003B5A564C
MRKLLTALLAAACGPAPDVEQSASTDTVPQTTSTERLDDDSASTTTERSTGPTRFTSVSAGTWHSCGVRSDATVTCWGDNKHGQADAP